MKHFSPEEWADFANQLAPPERASAMRRHLEDGCKKCGKLLQTWESIRTSARRLPNYDPPASAVQSVKAAFAMQKVLKRRSRASEVARLIFDSFRQPSLEGVRAISVATRKLLYRHGALQIDLSVEPLVGSDRLSIDGQILDSTTPGKPLRNAVVAALGKREELARTQTNSFGEFHLECPARATHQLSVRISSSVEVFMPLNLPDEAHSNG